MSVITIKTEDADKICQYFRNELEAEEKRYKDALELIENTKDKVPDFVSDFGRHLAEEGHKRNVELLTNYIGILMGVPQEEA